MDFKLPREIWLVGKGPSMDTYDWSKAGYCRIGINEAALIIPHCWAAVAGDYRVLDKYKESLDPKIIVFRKDKHTMYEFENMVLWSMVTHVKTYFATAPMAIQMFSSFGAKIFHFVGFDSIDNSTTEYADSIKSIKAEGLNHDGFVEINKHILAEIDNCKIIPIWEHRV